MAIVWGVWGGPVGGWGGGYCGVWGVNGRLGVGVEGER